MNENSLLLEKVKHGDRAAEEQLVQNNMKLVWSIAGRFLGRGCEVDDLSQIGAIGLIKAIHKFDASYGVKFSTYAVPVIAGEIKRFLRDDGMIKISRTLKEHALHGRKCAELLRIRLGREPTIDEIADESGIDSDALLEAFDAVIPVDTLTQIDHEGKETEMAIASKSNDEEEIINRILVEDMLKNLELREKQVIVMRYFRGKTQTETASVIGVSQVQISRIEKNAIQKLKRMYDG